VEVKTANIEEARICRFRRLLGLGGEEFGKDLKLRLEGEAKFEMMPQIWECVSAPQLRNEEALVDSFLIVSQPFENVGQDLWWQVVNGDVWFNV